MTHTRIPLIDVPVHVVPGGDIQSDPAGIQSPTHLANLLEERERRIRELAERGAKS